MKRLGDESGQAMVFVVLCMTCLLGLVAFAVDVGVLLRAKRVMQVAADSGAISGAAELNYGDVAAAARAATAQNGVTNGSGGATVTVNNPPLSGPHTGNADYVEVIAYQGQPTFFMKVFNRSSMTVSARAVATLVTGQGCIYTLGTSGTDIGITGNSSISVPDCGINVNSTSSSAINLVGNINLNAQSIAVVGGVSKTGNITLSPTPVTGVAPSSDPLAFLGAPTVPPSCTTSVNLIGNNTQTISAGCFSGISATGNSALTLGPGTYIVNGPLNITGNASITGSGVTLDLLGSSNLTGNISLNLTAPTSGTYAGVVLYQPSTNSSAISLTGNSGSTLEGVIYAPKASLTFTGNSGSTIYTDFVTSSLTLTGNSSFQSYAALPGSSSPIESARLVE